MPGDAKPNAVELFAEEPLLRTLAELCIREMHAVEVWLFGSRARRDHHPYSDWDVLAVVSDGAPEGVDSPVAAFRLRRKSGLHADLITARKSEFDGASDVVNTLSYAVAQDGILLALA